MAYVPYGYTVKDGVITVDEKAAGQVKEFFEKYISGLSLTVAGEQAGIEKTHSVMGRILKNILYLGNDVYPAIIDKETFDKAEEIRNKRAKDLGRIVELAGLIAVSLLRMIGILSTGDIQKAIVFVIIHSMVYIVFQLIAKKAQNYIGEGNFDIFMLILLAVGAFNTLLCVTIASVIGTCLYLPLAISKKHERTKPIPLAPLLYVGFVITLLGGTII